MAALKERLPRLLASQNGFSHLKTASRFSKRLIVFAITVLLGRRDIAVFDVIVLQGRRPRLAWFAASLARRLLLLAGSAHVVPLVCSLHLIRTSRRLLA